MVKYISIAMLASTFACGGSPGAVGPMVPICHTSAGDFSESDLPDSGDGASWSVEVSDKYPCECVVTVTRMFPGGSRLTTEMHGECISNE